MSTLTSDSPEILLAANKLGWPGLRPVQKEVLDEVLAGRNVIGVLPTSSGKSACFQLPAIARPGMVLVISPLIALMIDQVARLKRHDVAAEALHSLMSRKHKRETLDKLQAGQLDLLYVSPERLAGLDKSFFGNSQIQLIVIDECHAISEWGHDFRPQYQRIGRNIRCLADVPILALTATATRQVAAEIATVLGIDSDHKLMRWSPDRPKLAYMVVGRDVTVTRMVGRAGLPCLVYGSTRRGVEQAAKELELSGYKVAYYHAGMDKAARWDVQDRFTAGQLEVVVATCAFGMGIDHPGIRGVCHLEMPSSIESYVQESGRAGRDGGECLALCRATVDTLSIARSMVPMNWPSPSRVRIFWQRMLPLFEEKQGSWTATGQLQMTMSRLGELTGFNELEAASCLRILMDYGNINRIGYQERPCRVVLNRAVCSRLTGKRQLRVVEALEDNADLGGEVVGTVAFFREVIDLDLTYAKQLRALNAIRFKWADRCSIIEALHSDRARMDDETIIAVGKRGLARVDAAEAFLYTASCRRRHLLEWFGDRHGGYLDGLCCDRCEKQKQFDGVLPSTPKIEEASEEEKKRRQALDDYKQHYQHWWANRESRNQDLSLRLTQRDIGVDEDVIERCLEQFVAKLEGRHSRHFPVAMRKIELPMAKGLLAARRAGLVEEEPCWARLGSLLVFEYRDTIGEEARSLTRGW